MSLDPELFHLCALLHDVGLMTPVAGRGFTLRSAAAARGVVDADGLPSAAGALVEDAIVVHTTVGARPDRDGALGACTQFGAMVDLTGLRMESLPRSLVSDVLAGHPRGAFKREIPSRLEDEARAVPGGRFAFARNLGFALAVRWAHFAS